MKARLIKVDDIYRLLREDNLIIGTTDKEYQKAFADHCSLLSIKNCQAVECGYDLDELAVECMKNTINQETGSDTHKLSLMLGFKKGFQKALELMVDKKFSGEQLIDVLMLGVCFEDPGIRGVKTFDELKELAIERQQQNEWDVEVEMQKVKDETKIIGAVKGVKGSGNKITTYKSVPKLDADGCLILKRVI